MTSVGVRTKATDRRQVLRRLLDDKRTLVCVAGGLAGQAKFADSFGSADVFLVSLARSAEGLLGTTNAGLMTQTELIAHAQRVCATTTLPILVDCGSGFGNAVSTRRTASLAIQAGAAGMILGDEELPRRSAGFVPVADAAGKVRAAADARDEEGPGFVVVAKTSVRAGENEDPLQAAEARLRAYESAGADMLMLEDARSMADLNAIRGALTKPSFGTLANGCELPPFQQFQDAMLALAVLDMSLVNAAAIWTVSSVIVEGGLDAGATLVETEERSHPAGMHKFHEVMGFPQVREWEERYLDPDIVDRRYKNKQEFGTSYE